MKWSLFLVLFLVACASQPVVEETGTEVSYSNGVLSYVAIIDKPTPCNTLKVDQVILESFPVQVRIDITIEKPEPGTFCIQVITPEVVSGSMDIGHKPGSFSVYVDGEQTYSKKL